MKVKIIDILNKIANGEEVPKKIKWGIHKFEFFEGTYNEVNSDHTLEDYLDFSKTDLLEEVDILDKQFEEPKKIEELDNEYAYSTGALSFGWEKREIVLVNKINEIIDHINKEEK